MAASIFDIRFWFGTLRVADRERVVTKVAEVVYMSPQYAKAFAELLNKHIDAYEQPYGPIPTQDDSSE